MKYIKNFFNILQTGLYADFIGRQLAKPSGVLSSKVGKGMNQSNKNLYRRIISNGGFATHQSILEIGFGNGYFFREMFENNDSVQISGVELSEAMLAKAKRINQVFLKEGQLHLFHGKAVNLPFSNATFQAILAVNLIYFWKDIRGEIAEIHRCLAAGGRLYIGIRPYEILKALPFTGKEFNLKPDAWWISQFEQHGFTLESSQSFSEPDILFGNQRFPMAGASLVFKKN